MNYKKRIKTKRMKKHVNIITERQKPGWISWKMHRHIVYRVINAQHLTEEKLFMIRNDINRSSIDWRWTVHHWSSLFNYWFRNSQSVNNHFLVWTVVFCVERFAGFSFSQFNETKCQPAQNHELHNERNEQVMCIMHVALLFEQLRDKQCLKKNTHTTQDISIEMKKKEPTIEMWFHYLVVYFWCNRPLFFAMCVWFGVVSCLAIISSCCVVFFSSSLYFFSVNLLDRLVTHRTLAMKVILIMFAWRL